MRTAALLLLLLALTGSQRGMASTSARAAQYPPSVVAGPPGSLEAAIAAVVKSCGEPGAYRRQAGHVGALRLLRRAARERAGWETCSRCVQLYEGTLDELAP